MYGTALIWSSQPAVNQPPTVVRLVGDLWEYSGLATCTEEIKFMKKDLPLSVKNCLRGGFHWQEILYFFQKWPGCRWSLFRPIWQSEQRNTAGCWGWSLCSLVVVDRFYLEPALPLHSFLTCVFLQGVAFLFISLPAFSNKWIGHPDG